MDEKSAVEFGKLLAIQEVKVRARKRTLVEFIWLNPQWFKYLFQWKDWTKSKGTYENRDNLCNYHRIIEELVKIEAKADFVPVDNDVTIQTAKRTIHDGILWSK